MSRSSFSKRFTETFERTPMEFVVRARLHHAAHLLAATDLPVKVVAASVGYASRSHFSRAFREAYDTDPKTYQYLKAISSEPASPGSAASRKRNARLIEAVSKRSAP